MARRFVITGAVADGDYLSDEMSANYSYAELSSIQFFDGAGVQVTPTAGTYSMQGQKIDDIWRLVANSADETVLNAANAYDLDAAMPAGYNLMTKAKITLDGITGAVTFKAVVWRF